MTGSHLIRPLDGAELSELVAWAGEEGWNPGPGDAAKFAHADPDGFLGCFVNGQLASAIAAVAYGDDRGFIGLYITKPAFRGQGWGRTIWDAGIARLGNRITGLDGVPAQQVNYRSMGFVTDHETIRWTGILPALPATRSVRTPAPNQLDAILAYDGRVSFAVRPVFVRGWLEQPHNVRIVIRDGQLAGYGVLRRCQQGFKLGPLYADDAEAAMALMAGLSGVSGTETVSLDCPVPQTALSDRLAGLGFEPSFSTARMYRGGMPHHDRSRIFGLGTLELG